MTSVGNLCGHLVSAVILAISIGSGSAAPCLGVFALTAAVGSIPCGDGGRGNQSTGGTLPGVNDVGGSSEANGEPHFHPDCLRNISRDLGAGFELLAGDDVGQPA